MSASSQNSRIARSRAGKSTCVSTRSNGIGHLSQKGRGEARTRRIRKTRPGNWIPGRISFTAFVRERAIYKIANSTVKSVSRSGGVVDQRLIPDIGPYDWIVETPTMT